MVVPVLLDASNIFHLIYNNLSGFNNFNDEAIKDHLAYVNDRCWLVSNEELAIVWCLDSKPYWRSMFEPEYKCNRSHDYEPAIQRITQLLLESGYTYFREPKFEADDIVSAILHLTNFDKVYLASTDSDWLGLVTDKVIRVNPVYTPRLQGPNEVWAWLTKKVQDAPKKHRLNPPQLEGFECSQVWSLKTILGDSADNLPPGTDLGMISLNEPFIKLWERPHFQHQVEALKLEPKAFQQNKSSHYARVCLDLPITPFRVEQ